jgi:hypothetical protein
MSEDKAEAKTVLEAFKQFADNAGRSPEATFELLRSEYGEDEDEDGMMSGIDMNTNTKTEDEDEDEDEDENPGTTVELDDMEYNTELKPLVSKANKAGMIDSYPSDQSAEGLKNALSGLESNELAKLVNGTEAPEDEDEDESADDPERVPNGAKPDSWFPYNNSKAWYVSKDDYDIEAIPSEDDIRASDHYEASEHEGRLSSIRHNCAKNGLCESCEAFYAGRGDTCNMCPEDGSSNDSNDSNDSNADKVQRVTKRFDVSNTEAREAIEDVNAGFFETINKALNN